MVFAGKSLKLSPSLFSTLKPSALTYPFVQHLIFHKKCLYYQGNDEQCFLNEKSTEDLLNWLIPKKEGKSG